MADDAIAAASDDSHQESRSRSNYVWTLSNTGYYVQMRVGSGANHTRFVNFVKTTDAGQTVTWNTTTFHDSGAVGNIVDGVDIWYDRWTPSDTGAIIHIFLMAEVTGGSSFRGFYYTIDTSDDSVTAVNTNIRSGGTGTAAQRSVGMVKMEDGTLYVSMFIGGALEVWVSTDAGSSWTELGSAPGLEGNDPHAIYPTASSDNKDLLMVQWGVTTDKLEAKVWDDSATAWITPVTIGSVGDFVYVFSAGNNWSSTFRRSDKATLVAVHERTQGVSHALRIFEVIWSGSAVTVTELTSVFTGQTYPASVSISVSYNGTIYVTYLDGTLGSSDVQQVTSTDGGLTWSSATQINVTTADIVAIWNDPQLLQSRNHPLFNIDSGSSQASTPRQNTATSEAVKEFPEDGGGGPPGDVGLPGDDGEDGNFGQGFGVFPPVLELAEAGGSNGAALQGGPDIVEANEVELGPAQERLDIVEGNEAVIVSG